MQRQKRSRHIYENLADDDSPSVPLQKIIRNPSRFENTIEAQVQSGDTLQALALRFHCTVAEIKRLNKIDKDNEIFARKIIKVPITPHSVLLETLPIVHKSGHNSPKTDDSQNDLNDRIRIVDPLKNNQLLGEKLLVASVNASQVRSLQPTEASSSSASSTFNDIILSSRNQSSLYRDEPSTSTNNNYSSGEPLLNDGNYHRISYPRTIPVPPATSNIFDCSGSDCDISWACLFFFILALCFAIPLIYVIYVAEHLEKYHHHNSSNL